VFGAPITIVLNDSSVNKVCSALCPTLSNPSQRSMKFRNPDDVLCCKHIPYIEKWNYCPDLVLGPPFQWSGHVWLTEVRWKMTTSNTAFLTEINQTVYNKFSHSKVTSCNDIICVGNLFLYHHFCMLVTMWIYKMCVLYTMCVSIATYLISNPNIPNILLIGKSVAISCLPVRGTPSLAGLRSLQASECHR
jgi:hypothetical protein